MPAMFSALTRRASWLVALALWGCDDGGGLIEVVGVLQNRSGTITFDDTYVGMRRTHVFELRPEGRRIKIEGTMLDEGAFTIGAFPSFLEPGRVTPLEITFAPTAEGSALARLAIRSDSANVPELRIELVGKGLPVPDCEDRNVCTDDRFDLEVGRCAHAPIAGGCDDRSACTEGDTCSDGVCVGRAIVCKDAIDCTRDVCDPAVGCASIPDHSRCLDTNLCTDDRCGPSGCTHVGALDGSECGASVCQGLGVCRAGRCVPGLESPRQPEWTVSGADALVFPGLVDADENIYWLNCPHDNGSRFPCDLVSVSKAGVLRFDVPTTRAPGVTILTDELVIVAYGPVIEAYSQENGAFVWDHLLPRGICNGSYLNPSVTSLATDGRGGVLVGAWGSGCAASSLIYLDAQTGVSGWSYDSLAGRAAVAADEQGTAFVAADEEILSFEASGSNRWISSGAPPRFGPALAAAAGQVWATDTTQVGQPSGYASSNGLELTFDVVAPFEPTPIIADGLLTFLVTGPEHYALVNLVTDGSSEPTVVTLHRLPSPPNRPLITQPELTGIGTIAFVEHYAEARYYEYSRAGAPIASCPLYNADDYSRYGSGYGEAVLVILQDRIVVASIDNSGWGYRIHGFAAPGLAPATSGWVGAHGSRARDNRPR
jgi:hypothetical protein